MNIGLILDRIRAKGNCRVHPPEGLPDLQDSHELPDDLREFYTMCGGMELFVDSAFPLTISSPGKLVPANPIIVVGLSAEELTRSGYEQADSWYIIAESNSGNYITIDLGPAHLGRCYDSFWDVHPFNSTVVAPTFTALIERLLATDGEYYRDHPAFDGQESPLE
jgi:antitoxin YokJ